MSSDTFNLKRFVSAQNPVFETALAELGARRKQSHWMWFIFPQLRGLGRSSTAQFYGIASLGEARAYLAHPLLGVRLERCTEAVQARGATTLRELFGFPDDLKFHSSMTLFARASGEGDNPYRRALEAFWAGDEDQETLRLLTLQDRKSVV